MTTRAQIGIWLLAGWFLLLPPFGKDGTIRTDRPFAEWSHFSAYDSANACERKKSDIIDAAVLEYAKAQVINGKKVQHAQQQYDSVMHSECLPTEAVYPPAVIGK